MRTLRSALSEYAVEGYDVHAYSFLVKPVSESVLKDKVRSVIDLMSVDKPVYIEFKSKDGIDVVNIGTVLYIESFSHDVVVHTAEGAKKYPKRMRDIEDRLYEHDFFRIHKPLFFTLFSGSLPACCSLFVSISASYFLKISTRHHD